MSRKKRIRWLIILAAALFLYASRAVVGPFLLSGITAYILLPFVDLLDLRLKLPRSAAVVAVYLSLVIFLLGSSFFISSRLFEEVKDFRHESANLSRAVRTEFGNAPDWLRILAADGLRSLQNVTTIIPTKILPFFTGAVSQLINVFLFLSATFYLLRDATRISRRVRSILVEIFPEESLQVFETISRTFSLYLRGQLFLIVLMAALTSLFLAALGVRFFLLLGIFTGVAEVVPIIGPLIATGLAATVAFLDGHGFLGLTPLGDAALVVLVYFLLRQFEDLVVIPTVMSKIVQVHPLFIIFAVLAGGHLAGIWGLLLAIPLLASVRIVLTYLWSL